MYRKLDLESGYAQDSSTADDEAEMYGVQDVEARHTKEVVSEVALTLDQTHQELQLLKEEVCSKIDPISHFLFVLFISFFLLSYFLIQSCYQSRMLHSCSMW